MESISNNSNEDQAIDINSKDNENVDTGEFPSAVIIPNPAPIGTKSDDDDDDISSHVTLTNVKDCSNVAESTDIINTENNANENNLKLSPNTNKHVNNTTENNKSDDFLSLKLKNYNTAYECSNNNNDLNCLSLSQQRNSKYNFSDISNNNNACNYPPLNDHTYMPNSNESYYSLAPLNNDNFYENNIYNGIQYPSAHNNSNGTYVSNLNAFPDYIHSGSHHPMNGTNQYYNESSNYFISHPTHARSNNIPSHHNINNSIQQTYTTTTTNNNNTFYNSNVNDISNFLNNYIPVFDQQTHHLMNQHTPLNSNRTTNHFINGNIPPPINRNMYQSNASQNGNDNYSINRYGTNNSFVNGNSANDIITPEMLNVVNSSSMHAFTNKQVCQEINNILSGSTKDHQSIVVATRCSANKILLDRQNSSHSVHTNGIEMDDSVRDILRAAGYDSYSHCRHSNSHTNNALSYNDRYDIVDSDFNGYSSSSRAANSKNTQLINDSNDINSPKNTTARKSHPIKYDSKSTHSSCTAYGSSVVSSFDNINNNHSNVQSLQNNKLPDCPSNNGIDGFHDSIKSGSIDLSISSDEDLKNMEFGPVGSNPRKIGYYQQNGFAAQPPNFNTPTVVRRKSQNTHNFQFITNKLIQNGSKNTSSRMVISGPEATVSSRTSKSLGDNADLNDLVDNDVLCELRNTTEVFSELNINTNNNQQHSYMINNKVNYRDNAICIHGIMKDFCSMCPNNIPPIPHDSAITRMSSTINSASFTLPTLSFPPSPRQSSSEISLQNGVSPARQRNYPATVNSSRSSFPNSSNTGLNNNSINQNRSSSQKKDIFSRKVFVGGLPQDITESQIANEFKRFGELVVDWPHKLDNNTGLPPKGYAFLLFESADSVVNLINHCTKIEEKFFWTVSSQRSESKQVQIRPWTLTDSTWSSKGVIDKPIPRSRRTVFVGGIPRQAQARELYENMNHCFGGVGCVEIDVDLEYCYPKGAASVIFDNDDCYVKALETHFISLKLCGMEKRVEIKPFFSDDQHCDECGILMNSRSVISSNNNNSQNPSSTQPVGGQCFCVARECLKYFCENCWLQHQINTNHGQSHPNSRSNTYHRQFQFRRNNSHNGNNTNSNNSTFVNRTSTN